MKSSWRLRLSTTACPRAGSFSPHHWIRAALREHFASQLVEERIVEWDVRTETVLAHRRTNLGAIVLADDLLRDVDPNEVARALAGALTAAGVDALPWGEGARHLRQRLAFLHHVDPSWPDVSDAALATSIDAWLAPRIVGMRRTSEVARLDLGAALLDRLTWSQRAALDELAPTHYVAPSGSRVPIDYGEPEAPALAVRLQEMFGSPTRRELPAAACRSHCSCSHPRNDRSR